MFIGDVSLNDMKILTKGEQVFSFETKDVIELYAFKAGPFMLRAVIKVPKEKGARISLITHLPENRVKLIARFIGDESTRELNKKIDLLIKRMGEL